MHQAKLDIKESGYTGKNMGDGIKLLAKITVMNKGQSNPHYFLPCIYFTVINCSSFIVYGQVKLATEVDIFIPLYQEAKFTVSLQSLCLMTFLNNSILLIPV